LKFIKGLIGAACFGKGIMKFQQGRFEDAARLLEKSFRLDPEDDQIEFCNAYLGRSYLALGRKDDALSFIPFQEDR